MTETFYQSWLQDESIRKEVADALRSPVMASVMDYARLKGRPAANLKSQNDASIISRSALECSRIQGWHEALDFIQNLVSRPKTENFLEPEPYLDYAKEELQRRGLDPDNLPTT